MDWMTLAGVIITGACSVLAVVLSNNKANEATDAKLHESQAVTNTKLDTLTQKVDSMAGIYNDVHQLKTDVAVLKLEVSHFKEK